MENEQPTLREQKRALENRLAELTQTYKRLYETACAPLIVELIEINNRLPPEPISFEDGRCFTYTGPWPFDEYGKRTTS